MVYRWVVFGVFSFFVVLGGVVALIYAYQSSGLNGVVFSLESGFYDEEIELEINPDGTLLMQPIDIKYNMNGDDLEETSVPYDEKIKLNIPDEGYNLYTITAYACKEGGECTEPQTATYVLGKNLGEDVTTDIININSSQKNLYDYDIGIMVGGRTYDENFASGNINAKGNYNNRGKEWMRSAFVTGFNPGGSIIWEQEGYIGISGGSSSEYDVKSIKVSMELQDGNTKTFRLRSGSQDRDMGNIRSSIVDRLAEESAFDGRTGTKRVVVFLNGNYYGLFDMQETFSEQNLAQKFQLSKSKNVKRVSGSEIDVFAAFDIKDEYWEDLDSVENRDRIEELIDMNDYLKYFAIFILTNNTDWPMNNFTVWRYEKGKMRDNKYEDGRIRFLIRDTDIIYHLDDNANWFEGANGDIFQQIMDNEYRGAGSSFRKVMESEYYRQKFVDLLRDLIDGPFATENVLKIVDEEKSKIEHQIKLFYSDDEYEVWGRQIDLLKAAVSMREEQIRADVDRYFGVEL